MAITRFQNSDILVDSKVPVSNVQSYGLVDFSNQKILNYSLLPIDLSDSDIITETHIYSADVLVNSSENELQYDVDTTDSNTSVNLLITPELDVRLSDIEPGYYSIVYNFVNKLSPNLRILNINSDGTELELEVDNDNESLIKLFNRVESNVESQTKLNLGLNFGDNTISLITDISFHNNERRGEILQIVQHPTDTYRGEETSFHPSLQSTDDNIWIEFYREKRTSNNGDEVWVTTGRAARFYVDINSDGRAYFVQETESDGDKIYLTPNNPDPTRQISIQANLEYYEQGAGRLNRTPAAIRRFSKVRYYNNQLKTKNVRNVIVKLYKPLEDGLLPLTCRIDELVRESYIERVLVYDTKPKDTQQNFSPPNFKVDLGNYGKSSGTDLKSWNDLLDANLTTSQQIVDKYISSSFGSVDLNIDYTHFGNFVKYSSAVERVNNFKYKLELIEAYDARIAQLNHVSGAEALTNINQTTTRKNAVVSGMDGWERWMYNESTGSLYTHYSSSNYPIEPWPKQSIYPNVQYSVTSSEAIAHYNGLIDSASIFDALNDARLTKMIPSSIAEDPLNQEYVLFIDMIGHHFDITWSYINALTSINTREEHPYDGMPNNLLYDVAKSMGWKLTHGKDTSELWEFGLGTDKFGNVINSGSLRSKPHEQVNNEIWRRIVNNIPYLLKTRGSARAVKALISTYGIPQTFLSIREYGGPVIETEVRPYWEHDRFVYHLRMDGDNYITIPWDKITDINPVTYEVNDPNPIDGIELQFQIDEKPAGLSYLLKNGTLFDLYVTPIANSDTNGNIYINLRDGLQSENASILNVPLFDGKMNTLVVQRENSVDDINQDNTYTLHYRRSKKDRIVIKESASIDIDGSTKSQYNAAWTGSGDLQVWNTGLVGAIQEIRYWANPLNDMVIDEHTLSREMYHGNSPTSSYFDLKFRFIPDSNLKTITDPDSHLSQHPNQQVSTTELGHPLTASLFGFENDDLIGVTEEYYTKIPSAGANNIISNKVRVESNRLTGVLDPSEKKEKSQYDTAPVDSNVVGVYLAATRMYNEDIYNHTGYFDIDDYIGNPDRRSGYTEQNEELDYVRRQVFKKYASKNLINNTIDILAKYDMSVFEQIRQTVPARVDYNSGILIEPHILERPKAKSRTNVTHTRPMYDVTIAAIDRPIESTFIQYETEITKPYIVMGERIQYDAEIERHYNVIAERTQYETEIGREYTLSAERTQYDGTIDTSDLTTILVQRADLEDVGNPQIKNMYSPSTYQYVILNYSQSADVGYGVNWNTGSNGYWNYNPVATSVVNSRLSKYAMTNVYFYDTDLSASLKLSNSSSLVPAAVSTDELPLSVANLRYLGCKMTSDSLTTNSPDTPDGRPVIEVFTADPNVLIYTSQTAEEGNLDVDTSTGLSTLNVSELSVNDDIYWKRLQEYKEEVRAFRQKIESMIEIEENRSAEFDARYEAESLRRDSELERRAEFDIQNGYNG